MQGRACGRYRALHLCRDAIEQCLNALSVQARRQPIHHSRAARPRMWLWWLRDLRLGQWHGGPRQVYNRLNCWNLRGFGTLRIPLAGRGGYCRWLRAI